jgi:hypothetical protein
MIPSMPIAIATDSTSIPVDEERALFCVDDGVPDETIELIADACRDRDVACVVVDASRFDFDPGARAAPGDLVYRPAVSRHAQIVEQHLITPGVGTFYPTIDDAWFATTNPVGAFARAGIPVPRSIVCATTDRARIASYVERLGGLPIVVKVGGDEGGIGVMIVETVRQLHPLLDYLVHNGAAPLLLAFVPDAVHWRVVVVGNRVVAGHRSDHPDDDFRSAAPADSSDDLSSLPTAACDAALRATAAIRREHAGCDVLIHPSGRVYLLEANYPCYFPQAQHSTGVDIAGAMVDHLLAKAAPLSR